MFFFSSHGEDDVDDESSLSKMKASFSLIGIEYQDGDRPKFVGTVEYKKKNIRFQNRQLKMHKDVNKQLKHTYFDDDGNVVSAEVTSKITIVFFFGFYLYKLQVTVQQQSSGSSDLKDTCSSDEENADTGKLTLPPTTDNTDKCEIVPIKRKRRKKKNVLPAEIKDKPYLRKYWHKRFSLFSKFDQGIQLDEGGCLF